MGRLPGIFRRLPGEGAGGELFLRLDQNFGGFIALLLRFLGVLADGVQVDNGSPETACNIIFGDVLLLQTAAERMSLLFGLSGSVLCFSQVLAAAMMKENRP